MNKLSDLWTDRFGAVASSLCALHCAVCALLPALFAALGVGFLMTHEAEWLLNLVAILFGAFALKLAGRTHRSRQVMVFLAVGIVGLLVGRGLEMVADHGHHGDEHDVHAEEADHHEDDDHGHAETEEQADHHEDDDHGHAETEEEHDHGAPSDEHDDAGEEDDDAAHGDGDVLHSVGAGVGVLSGLMLFFGHLLNIRTLRRNREECCD